MFHVKHLCRKFAVKDFTTGIRMKDFTTVAIPRADFEIITQCPSLLMIAMSSAIVISLKHYGDLVAIVISANEIAIWY